MIKAAKSISIIVLVVGLLFTVRSGIHSFVEFYLNRDETSFQNFLHVQWMSFDYFI